MHRTLLSQSAASSSFQSLRLSLCPSSSSSTKPNNTDHASYSTSDSIPLYQYAQDTSLTYLPCCEASSLLHQVSQALERQRRVNNLLRGQSSNKKSRKHVMDRTYIDDSTDLVLSICVVCISSTPVVSSHPRPTIESKCMVFDSRSRSRGETDADEESSESTTAIRSRRNSRLLSIKTVGQKRQFFNEWNADIDARNAATGKNPSLFDRTTPIPNHMSNSILGDTDCCICLLELDQDATDQAQYTTQCCSARVHLNCIHLVCILKHTSEHRVCTSCHQPISKLQQKHVETQVKLHREEMQRRRREGRSLNNATRQSAAPSFPSPLPIVTASDMPTNLMRVYEDYQGIEFPIPLPQSITHHNNASKSPHSVHPSSPTITDSSTEETISPCVWSMFPSQQSSCIQQDKCLIRSIDGGVVENDLSQLVIDWHRIAESDQLSIAAQV